MGPSFGLAFIETQGCGRGAHFCGVYSVAYAFRGEYRGWPCFFKRRQDGGNVDKGPTLRYNPHIF